MARLKIRFTTSRKEMVISESVIIELLKWINMSITIDATGIKNKHLLKDLCLGGTLTIVDEVVSLKENEILELVDAMDSVCFNNTKVVITRGSCIQNSDDAQSVLTNINDFYKEALENKFNVVICPINT